VTFHDLADPGGIRRHRAADGYGHFPEEFRPENAWRENAKHFRNRLHLVDEPVDNTARVEGPWSFLRETMRSLTSPHTKRISGPRKFCSSPKKDFWGRPDMRAEVSV
jgi:hypothetical protein